MSPPAKIMMPPKEDDSLLGRICGRLVYCESCDKTGIQSAAYVEHSLHVQGKSILVRINLGSRHLLDGALGSVSQAICCRRSRTCCCLPPRNDGAKPEVSQRIEDICLNVPSKTLVSFPAILSGARNKPSGVRSDIVNRCSHSRQRVW